MRSIAIIPSGAITKFATSMASTNFKLRQCWLMPATVWVKPTLSMVSTANTGTSNADNCWISSSTRISLQVKTSVASRYLRKAASP